MKLKLSGRSLIRNHQAFVLNNVMKMREMLRYASPGTRSAFLMIPLLLQINLPDTPGYVPADEAPRGIFSFDRSGFFRIYQDSGLKQTWDRKLVLGPRPKIDSLMLMGSTGSIGQTRASDLDYWVCVDGTGFSGRDWELLKEKTELLAAWARTAHRTEVHFFILDHHEVRANRFGDLGEESSGQVMPLLLKEEFYRTLLHLAGRIPLWWVMPPETDAAFYAEATASLARIETAAFDPGNYLDLGYPEKPGPREYLGAALWQAHKAKKDPFKAVLKMILLLDQAERGLEAPLLCEQIKAEVLTAGADRLPVDAYHLTIRQTLKFAAKHLDQESLDLVRLAVWFKLQAPFDIISRKTAGPKSRVLDDLIGRWGWPEEKIKDLGRFFQWPQERRSALGREIASFLLDLYSRLTGRLRVEYPDQVKIDNQDLVRLNAGLMARYADHPAKVEDLPYVWPRELRPKTFTIIREKAGWTLQAGSGSGQEEIYTAGRLVRVAAWLIHNGLWDPERELRLIKEGRPLNRKGFLALMPILAEAFPPSPFEERIETLDLLPDPVGPMVLTVNLEESEAERRVVSADLLYRTTWGEMNHEVVPLGADDSEAEKYLRLAGHIFRPNWKEPGDLRLFVQPGPFAEEIAGNIGAALKSRAFPGVRPVFSAKSRLDKD